MTVSGDDDYTSVRAKGDLVLDGDLSLDVRGDLTPGTVLTIMSGRSICGCFHALPEGHVLNAGCYLFRVSYQDINVTLTVLRKLPPQTAGTP